MLYLFANTDFHILSTLLYVQPQALSTYIYGRQQVIPWYVIGSAAAIFHVALLTSPHFTLSKYCTIPANRFSIVCPTVVGYPTTQPDQFPCRINDFMMSGGSQQLTSSRIEHGPYKTVQAGLIQAGTTIRMCSLCLFRWIHS